MSEVIDADRQRLNSTGIRMIHLYFFETGNILPLNAKLKIAAKAGIHPHDEGAKTFAFAYSKCSDQRSKEIGGAFSYVVGFSPIASVWLILLYEYFVWMATVQT
jgi:nitrate reductase NapE component